MIEVENMLTNSGRHAPNQFIIKGNNGVYFQSYETVIAFKPTNGKVQLSPHWDYSRTTIKYLCQFLGLRSKREIERRIGAGEYVVVDTISL